MNSKELFTELAPDYSPSNDPWGNAMGAFFDVAAEINNRGVAIPGAWLYRPGPFAKAEVSEWAREVFDDLKPTDEELLRLGKFLHRLTAVLDHTGRSY